MLALLEELAIDIVFPTRNLLVHADILFRSFKLGGGYERETVLGSAWRQRR
jgi:hypothetical protein